ncbi:hypothetical protein KR009_006797, partial [Drosophila setifemur]
FTVIFTDPGSPLAPLTPLTSQVFTFETSADESMTIVKSATSNSSSRTALIRGLKPSHLKVPERRPPGNSRRLAPAGSGEPTRFSQAFMRTRSVFSPTGQSTLNGTTLRAGEISSLVDPEVRAKRAAKIKQEVFQRQKGRFSSKKTKDKSDQEESTLSPITSSIHTRFKHGSPVAQPTLSPRVRSLLDRTGNEHLTELFTRQEIDIEVLIQMTLEDLEKLGVRGAREVKIAMQIIQLAKQFF